MTGPIGRRDFLRTTAAVTAAAMTGAPLFAADTKPKLKKAVKYAMVRLPDATHREKLELVKKCGFLGVEIDSPGTNKLDELVKASKDTGVAVHGVIDSVHWKDTLSHPDEKVRAKGLEALKTALQDAKSVGADTVLLVPGVVNKDVTYEQCYERSQAEVRKALPLAEKLGVKIAIENVWNNFLLSPLEEAKFIDELDSAFVGAYFDVGNIVRYGWPSHWIAALGKRVGKLDIKEFSREKMNNEGLWKGFNGEIGEGDCDWPEVRAELKKIGYTDGWATAEVGGGGEGRLTEIFKRMRKVLDA